MKILTSIIVLCISSMFLFGTWKNDKETMIFEKDTIRVISSELSVTSAWRQDRRARPKRIYLLFDFGDETLEMPFAIYEMSGDTLRLEKTRFEGVRAEDYPHIPFPDSFTNKQWLFIKRKNK